MYLISPRSVNAPVRNFTKEAFVTETEGEEIWLLQ